MRRAHGIEVPGRLPMWCRACQQEVPGVRSPYEPALRCARCHTPLPTPAGAPFRSDGSTVPAAELDLTAETEPGPGQLHTLFGAPPFWDDWEIEEDLRSAERLLDAAGLGRAGTAGAPDANAAGAVVDAAASGLRQSRGRLESSRDRWGVVVSWLLLAAALFLFVLGGSLLAWSAWGHRPELWRLGLPCTLAGQLGLVWGLVVQLDAVWRSNRAANQTLAELDEELAELRQATTALATRHPAGRSFYVHMAQAVHPHLPSNGGKGRLDMAANRLSDDP